MNYVILNGVRSDSIRGLLISSLPSISKPLLRTEVEEIDGRDGDIVTPLGYSAYDKEMSIGLYGDYDVDEVISYFDSEGIVTFSNEPDKYYKYKIINQIDFERLLRFKTATVTFHVQPFKYSAVEEEFVFSNGFWNVADYSETKGGITLGISDGTISISGTNSNPVEFLVPISMELDVGGYSFSGVADGTASEGTGMRLTKSAPVDSMSFGSGVMILHNGAGNLDGILTEITQYNYLWIYVPADTHDFDVEMSLIGTSVRVSNIGNTKSRPNITIHGSGSVVLSVNGRNVFTINIPNDKISIDVERMEAEIDGQLANRSVSGDYDDLVLNVGTNIIAWSGNVSSLVVENYVRWI